MDNDDKTIGTILSRRAVLRRAAAGMGAAFGGLLLQDADAAEAAFQEQARQTVQLVASPALTEGPFFVDEKINRSDIRSNTSNGAVKAGTLLTLNFTVANLTSGCAPLSGATFDVWHCDAAGVYSDIGSENTSGQNFLRGYQTTDANGQVQFTTIYPGWYRGRAVHIHFKIRYTSGGQNYEFTSQFFFDDSLTDTVYTQAPYNTRSSRDTRNSGDGIYNQGGSHLVLPVTASGSGYAATFVIGLTA